MHLHNIHGSAHAKLNLFLHITGKRHDGYHLLDSLAIFADAADQLIMRPHQSSETTLHISGKFSHNLSNDKNNLILKAYSLLEDFINKNHIKTKHPLVNFDIELIKELPIASGIGGGSADAACILRLLQQYYDIPFSIIEEIAPKLGADVPVCLHQKTTRMQNIGEILLDGPDLPNFGILLVNPGVAVSTASIFKKLVISKKDSDIIPPLFPKNGWDNLKDFITFLNTTRNDLEKPAIEEAPIIATVLDNLKHLSNTRFARMSGSGATCIALFDSKDHALSAQKELAALPHSKTWWHWAGTPLLKKNT